MAPEDAFAVLDTELSKLQSLVSKVHDSTFDIPEIVKIYYQVMSVSSMCEMLTRQMSGNAHKSISDKIVKTQDYIASNFDAKIHPKILESLTASIQRTTKILRSESGGKSKEDIKKWSCMFEDLRKKMSTKEFVEQYQKRLL